MRVDRRSFERSVAHLESSKRYIMTRDTMDEDWDGRRDGGKVVPEYELRDFTKILLRNGKEHTSYYHYTNLVKRVRHFCICFTVYAWRNVIGFRGSLRGT